MPPPAPAAARPNWHQPPSCRRGEEDGGGGGKNNNPQHMTPGSTEGETTLTSCFVKHDRALPGDLFLDLSVAVRSREDAHRLAYFLNERLFEEEGRERLGASGLEFLAGGGCWPGCNGAGEESGGESSVTLENVLAMVLRIDGWATGRLFA